ncbi:MAG: ATP-binding protein [Campylobacterales bacterium]
MRECCYNSSTWKILIVDDEEDVISITKFALDEYSFYNKQLEFLTAKSAKEAIDILNRHGDIAVIFLDIIMEHNEAGFDVIKHLREELENHKTRIVIRTGEPGEYPETEVVHKYEINDYKSKGELTEESLNCSVTTALRSYCDLLMLEDYKNSESMMIHKSKLILFGEMMEMMLHQWQQPITSIRLLSDIAVDRLECYDIDSEEKDFFLENNAKIKEQTDFLAKISKDFRSFFNPSRQNVKFDFVEALEETLFIIDDLLRTKSIKITKNIEPNIVLVGDKSEFKHVILNLVKNSMDAYLLKEDEINPITIEAKSDGEFTKISFEDSAGGIDESMLPTKLFEPNKTTKKDGSGIGLWMCSLIVNHMGGKMDASNHQNGAKIEMTFVN